MKLKDDVCKYCEMVKTCPNGKLCAPLAWIDGNIKRREPLLRDISRSVAADNTQDYNHILSDMIQDARSRDAADEAKLTALIQSADYRTRAIGLMLIAKIPITDIAGLLHITRQTVWALTR